MKAYLANGILLADRDSAIVYSNNLYEVYPDSIQTIKSTLLPLDCDINIMERKANLFLHFDHPEFDPTANNEVYNSVEVEFSFDTEPCEDEEGFPIRGTYCVSSIELETINRNYKMEHLSPQLQKAIIEAITEEIEDYLTENN